MNVLGHFCDVKYENAVWKQLIPSSNRAWGETMIYFQRIFQSLFLCPIVSVSKPRQSLRDGRDAVVLANFEAILSAQPSVVVILEQEI